MCSYLVAILLSKNSIMTEKISRRGVHTPQEFVPDPLQQITAMEIATKSVVTLNEDQTITEVQRWFDEASSGNSHQGYPVVDANGNLIGIVTRRDVFGSADFPDKRLREIIRQPPRFIYDDCRARQAVEHMINHDIGRLPIMTRDKPPKLVGIVTRSDLLGGYRNRMAESSLESPSVHFPTMRRKP